MTLEKVVDYEVIEEQMVENQLMILISLLPGKIVNVIEDRFTKVEDALVDLKTHHFSSKNENTSDNVQNLVRHLDIDLLRKRMSDLEIELQRKNVAIDYLDY